MKRWLRLQIQHYANPLHVMCRLRDLGVSKTAARRIVARYESVVRPILYA